MEAVRLDASGALSEGDTTLYQRKVPAPSDSHAVLQPKPFGGKHRESRYLGTPPSHSGISNSGATHTKRLVQNSDPTNVDSSFQMDCCENSGIIRNMCCPRCSFTERYSRGDLESKSDFTSTTHTNSTVENTVAIEKHKDQHVRPCLCRDSLFSAFSPSSLISSASFFLFQSQNFSRKCLSSPQKFPNTLFLLLIFLFCTLHGVSASGTVVRASAPNPSCPQTFTDERSKALLADVVIEGKVRRSLALDLRTGYFDHVVHIRKNKVLKGSHLVAGGKPKAKQRLVIGSFKKGDPDVKNCVGSVTKGRTYFFYLRDIGDSEGLRFELMAMPRRRTKKLSKNLRDILCDKCAKAPKIRALKLAGDTVNVGKKMVLKCNAKGRPHPVFVWYKDGVEIKPRSGLVIKASKRRQSRLQIRRAQFSDNGTYTCEVKNAVGEDRAELVISVTEQMYIPCERQTFCLNGGTCIYIMKLERNTCKCTEMWSGRRCELLDGINVRQDYIRQSTLLYERTLIIIGIVIAALVFIVICIASYFLAKARRKRFEQRRRRREARRAARELEATPHGGDKHLANDVGVKESPHRPAIQTSADSNTTTALPFAYPAQHEIHPLLLKKQQKQLEQQQKQQQQQEQQQQHVDDETDPQLEALLRSCDPNHQTDAHVAGERPDSRKRLVASSYDNCDGVPSTFKACVDRRETTTAAVLHTTEDIEMNNMDRNGKDQHPNGNHQQGNSGIEEDVEHVGPGKGDVGAPFSSAMPDVSSPPPVSSPTSSSYSPRPPSSGSLSPPPYHRAVYIPSPSHHPAGEDESPEEEAARVPLLALGDPTVPEGKEQSGNEGPDNSLENPSTQYKRTAFQKHHAPPLNNVREWSSAPTPANPKANDSPIMSHTPNDYTERGYDSDEEMVTERDNLLGRSSHPSPPQNKKNKNPRLPSAFPTPSSVSHSNTFPKPSRVNGVVRGGSTSRDVYPNSDDDDSSSSDDNDGPREFPYQKQRDDLYISEGDLDLSKENLASTSFSSDMPRVGRTSRQLSRQESREMEEPVIGLLPSQNLKPPRDQLRKYPSEEGPAYSILACKAQGLHLQDDNRSKSLDDPLVSANMAGSSTNATASASSLSTSPYGSTSPLMSSAPVNGSPHYNNYHYPGQQAQNAHRPVFEGGSRLHSTQVGSPMVETYGENDERFGHPYNQNPNYNSRGPFVYDPNEDGKPWDRDTPTTQQDRSKDFGLQRDSVEGEADEEEKDRLQRLKDVKPDQPAIPI